MSYPSGPEDSAFVYEPRQFYDAQAPEATRQMRWYSFLTDAQPYLAQGLDPSDPVTGRSRLPEWITTETAQMFVCEVPLPNGQICKVQKNRLDRAMAHTRQHLDLKPFKCGGQCGVSDW